MVYELPEYRSGVKYGLVIWDRSTRRYKADEIYTLGLLALDSINFDQLCKQGVLFENKGFAKIETDRRNAEIELQTLAREREKIFPINADEKYYFEFMWQTNINDFIWYPVLENNVFGNRIYFCGFASLIEAGDWLRSVMPESKIQALCQLRRYA